ncbi:ATP-binding protein [Myxococcota bacterium]|jgi:MinD superfamily P-loop ATPase|nr:ATP-binding protein [Myxococcota bacterium]MBU1411314.1 ATP-binding protein [Myxococcota bacterium]MBU1509135.1 ATP-binding protein [Myxococcota bacterium]PKN25784.1 MAG: (4Fe-4S)-binding protein [Deltaproteobacteria bacterium HGW-Deltaproteobacteria-22]
METKDSKKVWPEEVRGPIWAVASGKGGTGKTTVAVNLAWVVGEKVQLVDCDVEEPDAHLFLAGDASALREVTTQVPWIDQSKCDFCGLCAQFCQFNALAVVSRVSLVFPELCHGCRGCSMLCPHQAISMVSHRVGQMEIREIGPRLTLLTGTLDVGSPQAGPVISAVKELRDPRILTILDAPPGTSCSVESTLRGVNRVVLVTEPTPFGLHDLKLIVELVRLLRLSFGVVINRMVPGQDLVRRYCEEEDIPVWLEIPEDRRYAEAGARGRILVDEFPELRAAFVRLVDQLKEADG